LVASQTAAEGLIAVLKEESEKLMEQKDIDVAIKVTKILDKVGNMVKSLDTAMKQAKAEQMEAGRIKGGGTIGLYETVR
jgi:hypothetical protein